MADPVVARRIKMARCGADLSRDDFAAQISDRIGKPVSDELIRRIETADRSVEFDIIIAVSEITGEPVAWLIDGATRPYVNSQLALVS